MADDSEVLAASGVSVTAGGEALRITGITLRELPAFKAAAEALFSDEGGEEVDVLDLYERKPEQLKALVALGTRRPAEWLEDLPYDDFNALAAAMIRANRNFFFQLFLRRERQKKASESMQAGPTSSPSSSPTDTPSATS